MTIKRDLRNTDTHKAFTVSINSIMSLSLHISDKGESGGCNTYDITLVISRVYV